MSFPGVVRGWFGSIAGVVRGWSYVVAVKESRDNTVFPVVNQSLSFADTLKLEN